MNTQNVFAEELINRYQNTCVGVHGSTPLDTLLVREWSGKYEPEVCIANYMRRDLMANNQIAPNEAVDFKGLVNEVFVLWRNHHRNR